MEYLNLIGNVSSILGLLLTIFIGYKVYKISTTISDYSVNKVEQSNNHIKNGNMAGRDINN